MGQAHWLSGLWMPPPLRRPSPSPHDSAPACGEAAHSAHLPAALQARGVLTSSTLRKQGP